MVALEVETKVVGAKGDGAFTTTAAEAYRGEKEVLLLSRAQFAALAPSMGRRESAAASAWLRLPPLLPFFLLR